MNHTPRPRRVPCPRCSQPLLWSTDNPYRPFCSERCKLVDAAAWANEEYRIPGPPALLDQDAEHGQD